MVWAAAVVGILVFGALGLGATLATPFDANSTHGSSAAASVASGPNVASTLAAKALAATNAHGLNPRVVSVPRPSASAAQVAQATSMGHVTPLYDAAPAPSGLAYYGLSEGKHGSVVPTTLSTSGLLGQVDSNGQGIFAQDLYSTSPDSFGIQLNAVTTNINIAGTAGYSYWTQDVVLYYPASDFMVLITNIWNFSGGSITNNALYSTELGCIDASCASDDFGIQGDLGYYYSELVVPFPVSYPWDLSLYMNSTMNGGRNAVDFSAVLTGPGGAIFNAPYDDVTFNSMAPIGGVVAPSYYVANGYTYNPIGLTDDFELDLGGPDGGSNADLSSADATLGLAYWDAQTESYEITPSAFNYGGETGETVTGANVAWADGSGGPAGFADWATVNTGPSVMRGLWNAGAPEGTVPLTLDITPVNAFAIFTPVNDTTTTQNFVYAQPFAESVLYGPTFWLTPGDYDLKVELSYYDQVPMGATTLVLHLTGPKVFTTSLHYNPLNGIYTPLWAFSNSELPAISTSGSGSPTNPYMLFNNQYRDLAAFYGLYNDYTFPVYPGVFLAGTSASTYLQNAPQFTVKTDTFQYPGAYLPPTNEPQMWFDNVSAFALIGDRNISGWFTYYSWYPLFWDSSNVVFYNSSCNLIAGNTFNTEGQGLELFSGGNIFGDTINTGGGDNTIWGNTFNQLPSPAMGEPEFPFAAGLGLQVGENGDLIYNNWFATPTTAWMVPTNLYSDYGNMLYTDTWNITPIGAAHINYAPGFPLYPLTGSIAGGSKQGGNFWWDYGTTAMTPNPYNGAVNPYGVLPYDENATTPAAYVLGPEYYSATYIYNGGDYAPFENPSIHL
jgi:thermopsin